jgi:hypothetical protein
MSTYKSKEMEVAFNRPVNHPDQEVEPQIAVDGFNQILEMLRVADPTFRESLLRRLAARDRTLAANLRRDLSN